MQGALFHENWYCCRFNRKEIAKLIPKIMYHAGIQWWNPAIHDALNFLLESQYWTRDALQSRQLEMTRRLLERAYAHSSFYRTRFDQVGFHPKTFQSLGDLARVPTVTKSDLIANHQDIQLRTPGEKHFRSETSGSSGNPLVFHRNATWDAWHRASVFRGYRWHDVHPWNRNGYLWGYNFSPSKQLKTKLFDTLQNRFRLFSYNEAEIHEFIRKLEQADFLTGYSSMIYEIAKRINRLPKKPKFRLKMIKGTSEKIYERYQSEVLQAFGRRMISEYGAAEAGIMAFECPEHTMHVNMETCVLEEVEQEVVVTNFLSDSFPIIRYRLGDYIEMSDSSSCRCGRQHPAVREVLGRVGKVIHGKKGQYPSLTLYYVFKNLALEHDVVLSYQARQSNKGILEVHVEGALSAFARKFLAVELDKYYGQDIDVQVVENADLKSGKGKRLDFVTSIEDE